MILQLYLQQFIYVYLQICRLPLKYICLIHHRVKDILQNNLNLFSQLAYKFQLGISLSKYVVMTLGKITPSKYVINNIQLKKDNFYKDL